MKPVQSYGKPLERGLVTSVIAAAAVIAFVGFSVAGPGQGRPGKQGSVDPVGFGFRGPTDCNGNGIADDCDIAAGASTDCNGNGVPDECDIADGSSDDCNRNGVPDECEEATPVGLVGTYSGTFVGNYDHGCDPEDNEPPVEPFAVTRGRIDSTVEFNYENDGALPGFDGDDFYVTWTGYVETPDVSGTYSFFTRTDDGARLWIDGELIIDQFVVQGPTEHAGTIELEGNRVYRLRFEYFEFAGSALAELRWQPPGQSKVIIPSEHLLAYRDCNGNGVADDCDIREAQVYMVDDGNYEAAVRADGLYTAWLNRFTVVDGLETIGAIDISIAQSCVGQPVTLYVWSDPDGDGDPTDATVLTSVSTTAPSEWDNSFGPYRVDIPDTVVGSAGDSFFVGVINEAEQTSSDFPAAADLDAPHVADSSWVMGYNTLPNPNDLSSGAVEFALFEDVLPDGNWTVRPVHAPVGDCNLNGIPDECDVADGTSEDINENGVPDECECLADLDGSGVIDLADLSILLSNFGTSGADPEDGDLNGDDTVDVEDLSILVAQFGLGCD